MIGEVQLEAGHTGQRSGGCADLGGEVGKCCEVVAEDGCGVGEAVTGDLHPVTGITREADDYLLDLLDYLCHFTPLRTKAARDPIAPAAPSV